MRPVEIVVLEPRLHLEEGSVQACLRAMEACMPERIPEGCLEVAFVDPDTCRRLHADFFGDPEVTDVMTFPGDPADRHAGDIAICPEVAAQAAREANWSFQEELTLYLVHAWLHLAGLDDRSDSDRAIMRREEDRLLHRLREADALLATRWPD